MPAPALPPIAPRDGFAFATRFKVRYAEIDGQRVVFNARYLDYADVASSEFWDSCGIAEAVGEPWLKTEFHVRHAAVDYLKPFVWGDTIDAYVRIARLGGSSIAQRIELVNAATGALHTGIDMTLVNVHLPTGRATPLPREVRAFLQTLAPAG